MQSMTKATKKPAKAPAKATPAETAENLGKTQLVDRMTTDSLSKKDAAAVFDAVIEVLTEALKTGKSVGLPGLGTFSVKATAARQGVKPGTSEKIQIPAGKKVAYKIALDLKKSL
jgi:DNA-binding protein HU-beta